MVGSLLRSSLLVFIIHYSVQFFKAGIGHVFCHTIACTDSILSFNEKILLQFQNLRIPSSEQKLPSMSPRSLLPASPLSPLLKLPRF
jgi:hypothetical protein